MQVHQDINNLPDFKNAVITIGTFDGVHTGHIQIIHQLKKEAALNNGESVIITFDPHPRMVIQAQNPEKKSIQLLNTLSEKIELLSKQEIDHLVIVPFTQEFSNQSAENYISEFLVSNFQPKTIITGYDHRFGKNRSGNYQMLEKFQQQFNYEVKEIPAHILDHVTISSTRIRNALNTGQVSIANDCLGYDYFFEGRVIEGNKIGRTLGYPTANLEINDKNKLVPADGIYAVNVSLGTENSTGGIFIAESVHQGMLSIGIRPTSGDNKRMIEVNIFDFNENIYGRMLRVYIKDFLRKEEKFDNLEELKKQIAIDEINAKRLLNEQ
ncbi:MAG: bifunctional riboflavin kinase/FAD synthetase [Ginsengibacter sp.]